MGEYKQALSPKRADVQKYVGGRIIQNHKNMKNSELITEMIHHLMRVGVNETVSHYVALAASTQHANYTESEKMYRQTGFLANYLHEIANRQNALANVWGVFDRVVIPCKDTEHEIIVRLLEIEDSFDMLSRIELCNISGADKTSYKGHENAITANVVAIINLLS